MAFSFAVLYPCLEQLPLSIRRWTWRSLPDMWLGQFYMCEEWTFCDDICNQTQLIMTLYTKLITRFLWPLQLNYFWKVHDCVVVHVSFCTWFTWSQFLKFLWMFCFVFIRQVDHEQNNLLLCSRTFSKERKGGCCRGCDKTLHCELAVANAIFTRSKLLNS